MIAIVSRIMRNPDDAADVFQEVLAVIWRKLPRINCHPNPHAYILRICVSRSYDALRKRIRCREVRLDTDKAAAIPAKTDRPSTLCQTAASIRQAVTHLPPNQAHAVLLRIIDQTPYDAISRILGCSENTARSHFSKGKAKLQKILSQKGIL